MPGKMQIESAANEELASKDEQLSWVKELQAEVAKIETGQNNVDAKWTKSANKQRTVGEELVKI